jgi:ABC-2 type transport system ATP-binding protein
MNNDLIIDVRGLSKHFGARVAVDNVALQVERGQIFAFLGPNGSGKTTTIRMLCGLLTPDAGEGTCLGFDILKDAAKIKMRVGYMTQKFSFYEDLSVEENLYFIAKVYNIADRNQRIQQLLSDMGLTERRHQLTGELSGGWKQRVALTACLLHNPDLLLLDEPTSGVDPMARRMFWDTIHALSERGITTFVSTHYMEEALYCTRIAYLANSKLLVTGTIDDIIRASGILVWQIQKPITMPFLQKIKTLPCFQQVTLLDHQIRVCGVNDQNIQQCFELLRIEHPELTVVKVPPTLEDAFIGLVKASQGELC